MIANLEALNIRRNFDRAAMTYDNAATVQKLSCSDLIEYLTHHHLTPNSILDVGCGTGYFRQHLAQKYHSPVIQLDFAERMLTIAKEKSDPDKNQLICADFNAIPFADQCFDLAFSNLSLQWSTNILQSILEIYRVLTPNGYLALTMLGTQTMNELRHCWQQIDDDNHVNNFLTFNQLIENLQDNQFTIASSKKEIKYQYYPSLSAIMHGIKNIGANYVLKRKNRTLCGKINFKKLINLYEEFRDKNNLLPVTYEIFYIIAKKG